MFIHRLLYTIAQWCLLKSSYHGKDTYTGEIAWLVYFLLDIATDETSNPGRQESIALDLFQVAEKGSWRVLQDEGKVK